MNPKVDAFLRRSKKWEPEFRELRRIVLASGLSEELKWGWPCYALNGKNVALVHGFKEYCAILFIKGALLKDPKKILIQQTENVQAGRQVRFASVKDIKTLEATLKAYLREAIANEKAGKKVELKKIDDYKVPGEFQAKLDQSVRLKKAFQALTPGRQRGYLFHFSQPKLAKTREARIEKLVPKILAGKGMDD